MTVYCGTPNEIRHPITDYHRHNETHPILMHEISNLSPSCCRSATPFPHAGKSLLPAGARGSVFHYVNDWSLERRLTERWSPPRTELESRIRPEPVACRCQ